MLAINALLIRFFYYFFFTELAPLGRFSHRVAMSRCLSVCLSVCQFGPRKLFFKTSSKKNLHAKKMQPLIFFFDPLQKMFVNHKKTKKNYGPLKKCGTEKKKKKK